MPEPRARNRDQGFTLIELLVVMVILSILSGIAIPVFLNQRQKAVDASLKQDLRVVVKEAETFYVDHLTYEDFHLGPDFTDTVLHSPGNTVEVVSAVADGYCLRAFNPRARANSGAFAFWYDSRGGGMPAAPGPRPTGGAC